MARRFGDILGGGAASSVDLGTSSEVRDDFWAEEPERHRASDAAPASPAASNQTSGGSGIRRDGNGRYVVAGWTFSTLDQALEFEADRAPAVRTPTSQPPASPAPAVPSTPVASFPTSQSVTPASSGRAAPRWIGSPEALSAGGVGFETEMVYFGTPLRHEPRHDHSRIDPTLKVDMRGDPAGTTLGYWPSYREFDPRARATYLGWLTDGRRAVSVPSGYLFVFFYGLEQRLLVDDARADAPAIFSELRRLMALHHQDYSFQGHASRLLALAALYEDEDDDPPTAECARNWDVELPLDVRIRLGRRLRDGVPFNADDALRWVLALPDVHLRTPGQRCFAELRDLWSVRFAVRHPDGLTVRRPKRTLRHEYRAASGKFSVNLSVDELPDVSGISAPLGQLRAMLDLCIDDLSAYSRLVGRDPDARGRLHAELLLPVELRDRNPALASCRERLEKLVSGGTRGVIAAIELARLLDLDVDEAADKLPTAVVRQIGMALDALQHGLEPDRRYGPAPAPRADTPMAVFPAHGGGAVEHERQAYADARTAMEVAVLAAASDGEVVAAELEAVERRLRSTPNLAEHEIARLVASGRALAADPPKVRAAMKRLADAPATARASIATAAVEAVLADGMVQPGEVKFLETLHATLNLPASALYAALHRGAEDEAEDAGSPVERVIDRRLAPLLDMLGGHDFACVLKAYWRAHEDGDDALKAAALRWLRAEFPTKTEARQALPVRSIIDDADVYDTFKLLSGFVRIAGYAGLLVVFDELVNLYKLQSAQARNQNYEQILRMLNDVLQGNVEGLGFVLGGTPDFLLDSRRGLYSYQALQSRLAENSFATEGRIDMTGPVLRLQSLSPEDLLVLLSNIRSVFALGDPAAQLVPDEALTAFMEHCNRRIGEAYFRTPRNTIKAFVQLLAVLEQNPGTDWRELIGGVTPEPEEAEEADADDELVDLRL